VEEEKKKDSNRDFSHKLRFHKLSYIEESSCLIIQLKMAGRKIGQLCNSVKGKNNSPAVYKCEVIVEGVRFRMPGGILPALIFPKPQIEGSLESGAC
jgi:hypothetical protein